jgi:hypothetical protein
MHIAKAPCSYVILGILWYRKVVVMYHWVIGSWVLMADDLRDTLRGRPRRMSSTHLLHFLILKVENLGDPSVLRPIFILKKKFV